MPIIIGHRYIAAAVSPLIQFQDRAVDEGWVTKKKLRSFYNKHLKMCMFSYYSWVNIPKDRKNIDWDEILIRSIATLDGILSSRCFPSDMLIFIDSGAYTIQNSNVLTQDDYFNYFDVYMKLLYHFRNNPRVYAFSLDILPKDLFASMSAYQLLKLNEYVYRFHSELDQVREKSFFVIHFKGSNLIKSFRKLSKITRSNQCKLYAIGGVAGGLASASYRQAYLQALPLIGLVQEAKNMGEKNIWLHVLGVSGTSDMVMVCVIEQLARKHLGMYVKMTFDSSSINQNTAKGYSNNIIIGDGITQINLRSKFMNKPVTHCLQTKTSVQIYNEIMIPTLEEQGFKYSPVASFYEPNAKGKEVLRADVKGVNMFYAIEYERRKFCDVYSTIYDLLQNDVEINQPYLFLVEVEKLIEKYSVAHKLTPMGKEKAKSILLITKEFEACMDTKLPLKIGQFLGA